MDGTIETLEIIIRAKVDEAIKGIQSLTDAIKREVNYSVRQMDNLSQKMEDIGKVKIDITKINKDINKVKQKIKEINKEEIKPNIDTYDISEFKSNIMGIISSSESLKGKISSLGAEFSNAFKSIYDAHLGDSIKKGLNIGISGVKQIGAKAGKGIISGLKNGLKGLGSTIKNIFGKASQNITKSMDKGLSSLKKFTLSLISVRGAFTIISKATSAYLAYDEQLNQSLTNSWNVLGSLLAPALEFVINLFSRAVSYVASFVKALTGIDLVARANAKSMKNQAKATKEANRQLSSIDDISTLSSSSTNESGGISPITTESTDMGILDQIVAKFKQIGDLIKNGDFGGLAKLLSSSLVSGLNNVANFIKNIDVSGLATGISDFLENIDFSKIFTGLVEVFGESVLKLQEFMSKIKWEKILKNLYSGISSGIAKITEYLSQINFEGLGERLSSIFMSIDWTTLFSNIIDLLWTAISQLGNLLNGINWSGIAKTLSDTLRSMLKKIVKLFQEVDWFKLGEDIVNNILDFFWNIDWWGLVSDLFNVLASAIEGLVKILAGAITKLVTKLWNGILDFFGVHSPSKLLQDFGKNLVSGLINGLNGIKEKVVAIFSNVWNGIKNCFKSVTTFFKNTFITPIENIKTTFKNIFDSLSKYLTTPLNLMISGVEKFINGLIKGFNSLKKSINKISFNVPKWVPEIGGKKWGFNLQTSSEIKLPRLATGNVATEPTIAMFGEYSGAKSNPEITAPQKTMENSFRKVLSEQSNMENQHITINVAGKNFFDEVINYINDKSERNGVSVIKEI